MYVELNYNELQSIENLISNRINQLRIDIDGDAENEDEFKEIIRSYKKLLKKLQGFKNGECEEEFLTYKEIEEKASNAIDGKLRKIEDSNKTFKEIFPPGFENVLKVYVYNNKDQIAKKIKEIIDNDKFKSRAKEEVGKFIANSNPMISKFINSESIQKKLLDNLRNYVEDDKNIMEIVFLINGFIDELKDKKIKDFLVYVPYEGKKTLYNFIRNTTLDFLKK
ncbi:hypothetical protein BD780_000604 [Clostridium tetanomorphum]|uniref:hypothetical protein n=1 Tax=Clostridium tetanomorphum TaxID=1553 RepID=UPI0004465184|nr:hypothetical protein [Clostridium tetanomorphum]KAJ51788.1 hypothetical protein CTM_10988 [Clostridium tetanomorphum DSM 665]MBP1865023.1 hypothetical protein [Clostridium tetanomorphum]NRS83379.1 hypothetical protein [Clostridium tetanomorphum]SQC01440.1 Uncharacterised protein [Clostridium tetanomorphum]